MAGKVGLFFYVEGRFLFHSCPFEQADHYADFIGHPQSHDEIWTKNYMKEYGVDFDFYPRGRVVYRKSDDTYLIFCEKCIENKMSKVVKALGAERYELLLDEHYKCHLCNEDYVV